MAQLDVYRSLQRRDFAPAYLLDVQADLLSYLETRVVVPLRLEGTMIPARRLNPVFEVEGRRVVMATAEIAAIPAGLLSERIASLETHRYDIINAIDVLWSGI